MVLIKKKHWLSLKFEPDSLYGFKREASRKKSELTSIYEGFRCKSEELSFIFVICGFRINRLHFAVIQICKILHSSQGLGTSRHCLEQNVSRGEGRGSNFVFWSDGDITTQSAFILVLQLK